MIDTKQKPISQGKRMLKVITFVPSPVTCSSQEPKMWPLPQILLSVKMLPLVAGFSSQPQAENTAVLRSRCLFLRASLYCRICTNFMVGMKFQTKTHGFINDQLPDLNNLRWASLVFKSSVLLLPAHGTPGGQG